MKKSELIKGRYEVLCKMEKEMNATCRKCPFAGSQFESYSPECKQCPTLKVLKSFGDELTKMTVEYRSSNGKASAGVFIKETGEEVIKPAIVGKKLLERDFNIEEFKIYRSRGLSIREIAVEYGVSGACLNNFLKAENLHYLVEAKRYENNNPDFMQKNLPIHKVIQMIENGSTIISIAKEFDITKTYLDDYIKAEKKKHGIEGKIKKKRTTPQIKNVGGFN